MENFKQGTAHVNLSEYMELLKMKEAVMNGKKLVIHSLSDMYSSSESFIYFTESEMLESMIEINRDFLTDRFQLKQKIKKLEKEKDIRLLTVKPVVEEDTCFRVVYREVRDYGFWEFIKLKYFS